MVNWPTLKMVENPSSNVSTSTRLKVVSFGDGYAQRTVDGINARPRTYQLNYTLLDSEDAATLRNFLEVNSGGQAVSKATVPTDGVVRKWMITSDNESVDTPTTRAFNITLVQVFDPE